MKRKTKQQWTARLRIETADLEVRLIQLGGRRSLHGLVLFYYDLSGV